ncbi:hypothetical protein SLEP1_g43070 [Rubroshorea leprosula]|uniref:Uncharacterized protein n=1 Tax=Rubroshorea leprosula TaxID=152421 RepID=A0AAV5LBV4_9ROSI|nr:hypothetical protein SLEP1_g43070 [Rubroshorea leprosula]
MQFDDADPFPSPTFFEILKMHLNIQCSSRFEEKQNP